MRFGLSGERIRGESFRLPGNTRPLYITSSFIFQEVECITILSIPYESSSRATYEALVIPLSESDNPSIVINVDGAEYSYKIPREGHASIFTGGYQYTFNITVKEEGLDVSVGENIVWGTDGEIGSGTVELP